MTDKILLVEDNKLAAFSAKANIEKLGYECDVTSDGESALQMFSKNYYSMVLMDLSLGEGISGYETTRKIRDLEAKYRRDSTRVIALTAYDREDVLANCQSSGMDEAFQKPLTKQSLRDIPERTAAY